MENFAGIIIPFCAIFIGELGDNSFLLLAYLSTKTHRRKTILAAALLAYLVMNSTSAWLGHSFKQWIDLELLRWATGGLFIALGMIALLKKEETEKPKESSSLSHKKIFFYTLGTILAAEVIDRSNIGTGLFATHYPPLQVVIGVFSAHMITSILAIEFGKRFLLKINPVRLTQIAALIFIGSGALILSRV